MSCTIWKFHVDATDKFSVKMPPHAKVLSVQTQFGNPFMWVMVDPRYESTEERFFEVFGTGHDIPVDIGVEREYIGTFQLMQGTLIFHLFERLN